MTDSEQSENRDEKGRFVVGHTDGGPGGRKSQFHPDMCEHVRKLALLGLTDAEMSEYFGVTQQTFDNWKKKYPAFFGSLMEGKTIADANVAESLYKRATGEHIEVERAFKDKEGKIEIVKLKTWNPGDPGAAKLWLTNRRRQNWREKQDDPEKTSDIHIHFDGLQKGVL